MKVINLGSFKEKPYTVFILTYLGLPYFVKWSHLVRESQNIQFVLVDNGNQNLSGVINEFPIIQTSENIGCAGGWNLACKLAFEFFTLDKCVIGQDDAIFDEVMIESVWKHTTDDTLVGAYNRSFEFSLFGITKVLYNTVGKFDENFIYVGCEDNDYKHRIKLSNKFVKSLNYSADMNSNLSSKFITENAREANEYNVNFIEYKWGKQYQYTHPFNNPLLNFNECQIYDGLMEVYGDIKKFPSELEYEKLLCLI